MTLRSRLLEKGMPAEEADQRLDSLRLRLIKRGMPLEEIDSRLGKKPIDDKPIIEWYKDVFNKEIADRKEKSKDQTVTGQIASEAISAAAKGLKEFVDPATDPNNIDFSTALKAGFQASTPGLYMRGSEPDTYVPKKAPIFDQVVASSAQVIADLPVMAGGFLAGGALGVISPVPGGLAIGGGAGALAAPAALRRMLIDSFKDGEIDTWSEFGERFVNVLKDVGKEAIIGAATGGAGALVTKTASRVALPAMTKPIAEVTTMVSVANAIEGEMPNLEDFVTAGVVVAGLSAAGRATAKTTDSLANHSKTARKMADTLQEIYYKNGRKPADLLKDAIDDPRIMEDLLGDRTDMRSYPNDPDVPIQDTTPPTKPNPEVKVSDTTEEVLKQISIGEKDTRNYTLDDFYTDYIDRLHPINRFVKDIKEGKDIDINQDPYIAARNLGGVNGKAEHFFKYGTFKFGDNTKIVGKSFDEIMSPITKDTTGNFNLKEFRSYITSRRAVELANKDIETPIPSAVAQAEVAKYGAKYQTIFDELKIYQNDMLTYLKDSGIISEKNYSLIQKMNQDYVAFQRVMEVDKPTGLGKGLLASSPIRKIKGSEKKIIDPLESIMKNTYLFINAAERNAIASKFVDLANVYPEAAKRIVKSQTKFKPITLGKDELKQIADTYGVKDAAEVEQAISIFRPINTQPRPDEIVVYKDGKSQVYKVDKEIAEVFKGLDETQSNWLIKALGAPTKLMRAGITLDPSFMARNVIRDQLTASIFSQNNYRPIIDMFSGAASVIRKDDAYKQWLRSGGANATFVALDRNYLQNNMQKILTKQPVLNQLKNPVEILRAISEITENATRVGDFKRALKKGKDPLQAAYESREVTLDFARRGAKTKALNSIMAFWNANVQGTDRLIREFKTNPKKATALATAYVTVPSIMLHLSHYNEKGELEEWYKDIPDWQKDLYWLVDSGSKDERGEQIIYRIPKPFTIGVVFGTGVEKMMDSALTGKPSEILGILKAVGSDLTPGIIPTAAAPFLETAANESLFTGAPLVPRSREGLLSQYQYKPYTSQLTRNLSKVINEAFPALETNRFTTPAAIDSFVSNWTGTLGNQAWAMADSALRNAGVLPNPPKPKDTLADLPLVKSFIIRNPQSAQAVQDFYDKYDKINKVVNSAKKMAKEGNIEDATTLLKRDEIHMRGVLNLQKAIGKISTVLRLVHEHPTMDEVEKRQLVDTMYKQMNLIAKRGLDVIKKIEEIKE